MSLKIYASMTFHICKWQEAYHRSLIIFKQVKMTTTNNLLSKHNNDKVLILTCAAQPWRLATWSILFESLNQSTATRSSRCLPAGTFTVHRKGIRTHPNNDNIWFRKSKRIIRKYLWLVITKMLASDSEVISIRNFPAITSIITIITA